MENRTVIALGSSGSLRRGVRLNGMYEIETLIAQGGMGEVYKGFNIQTLDPVAIKMILPEWAKSADVFALFRREASTLHNLQHEAIVRYFGFSVDPDLQRAYLAMEFVDGPSLAKRLAQKPLSLAEVAILRKRIAGAMEAAHRFGVIHRDISSDNIILPGNDPRRAKIIDFGIARLQRPGEGTLIGETFAGKYNYVAPEQLGLAGGQVTEKSDIYSFGLVLAEALRGRPIDMNGTQVEVIEKRRAVPDLSDIDPSMRPLLQAMLQPLPADRPASMAVVADWDERDARAGGGDRERGEPASARQPRSSWAGRLAGALGVLIVIASLAGTAYVFRDMAPWSNPAHAPAGATEASNANHQESPVSQPTLPSAPTHNPPALPDLPPSQANGPNLANAPPQRPPFGRAANSSPTPPAVPHVPTADEILQAAGAAASHEPNRNDAHPGPAPATSPTNPSKPADAQHDSKVALATTPAPVTQPAPAAAPHAPQPFITMDDAVVGKDYVADLPPFSDSANSKALVLRADPGPPEGLVFADLGSGFSRISGAPSKPGQYSFEISATNASGAAARMTARIAIAPAVLAPVAQVVADTPPTNPPVADNPPNPPRPVNPPAADKPPNPPPPVNQPVAENPPNSAPPLNPPETDNPPNPAPVNSSVASLTPADRAADFMRAFNGGACFLARPQAAAGDSIAIEGIGSDKATLERFYGDFIHEIGVEPVFNVRLIGAAECPAVDLIRAIGSALTDAPKIDLTGYDAGRGKPLQGTVSNLAGRRLDLLVVSSNGNVYRVDAKIQPGSGGATFTAAVPPDATAGGLLQLLLAIASTRPVHALEGFKSGPARDILPKLREELPAVSAALDVDFFKLAK